MRKSKEMCLGCENDFYNGKNNLGVKCCWSYKTARIVKRQMIHYNQVPPYTQEPIKVLSCRRVKNYAFIEV
jgi:hypothetical protein